MRPDLILHVNYVEHYSSVLDMCRKASELGCDGIELRRQRTGVSEAPEHYLDAVAAAFEKSGLNQVIFGSPGADLMSDDPNVRAREVEELIAFFEAAIIRFPLSLCNLLIGSLTNPDSSVALWNYSQHGSYVAEDRHWDQAIQGMKEIGSFGLQHGLRFAFETHMNYLHDTPLMAKELVDRIACPAVGVNLDYGNAVYFPNNPTVDQVIPNLGSSLFYIHLKNSLQIGDRRTPTSLKDGEINHRRYLEVLKANNYSGPICVEAPRPGDRETFALEDMAYLQNLIEEINWEAVY